MYHGYSSMCKKSWKPPIRFPSEMSKWMYIYVSEFKIRCLRQVFNIFSHFSTLTDQLLVIIPDKRAYFINTKFCTKYTRDSSLRLYYRDITAGITPITKMHKEYKKRFQPNKMKQFVKLQSICVLLSKIISTPNSCKACTFQH